MELNNKYLSYAEWMKAIDAYLMECIFLDQDSLPDWLSRDAYERGDTVQKGADQCMNEAGMGFEYLEEMLIDEA